MIPLFSETPRKPVVSLVRALGATLLVGAASLVTVAPASPAEVGVVRAEESNFKMTADDRRGRGRDAPGLAVNPQDTRHIAAVSIEIFKGDCDHHVTFDGGKTWSDGHLTAPEDFPTPLCQTGNATAMMDQSIVFDGAGGVVTAFTASRRGEDRSVLVAQSTDGGRSYPTATVALSGAGSNHLLPKLVVDHRSETKRIYLVARRGSTTVVARSDDHGATWAEPVAASATGETAVEQTQPVVDPAGNVYVGWRVSGNTGTVVVAKSSDGGDTWTRTTVAEVRGYQGNTQSTFPRLAADDRDGTLYVVYGQGPNGESESAAAAASIGRDTQDHFIHPDSEVLLSRSTDGNQTWSKPLRVSDSFPGIVTTRHPWVSVAPDGRVDVVWHDRRHAYNEPTNSHGPPVGNPNGEARLGDTYYAYSIDGGVTFSPNRRLTDRTFNNDIGLDYRVGTYWSYGPVAVPIGNDRILTAWMESRNGNVHNENQDIYMSYVDLRAEGAPPVRSIAGATDRSTAVNLARAAYPGGPEAVLSGTFRVSPVSKVVVVNENDAALVSAAGVLGRANLGPVLVSAASGLDAETKDEVVRMEPIGAFVIGDESALSAQVVDDLVAAGVERDTIVRLAGGTAAETAAEVAAAMDQREVVDRLPVLAEPAFGGAVIVNPASPTAVLATSLASARRLPVLFVERDAVPEATADALESLAIKSTLVIGGPDDISDAVAEKLPSPKRLGGAGVRAVSEAVSIESAGRRVATNNVFVGDPARPVEAALLGATAGRMGGIVVLTADADVTAAGATVEAAGLGASADRFFRIGRAAVGDVNAGPRGGAAGAGRSSQLPATGAPSGLFVFGMAALALGLVTRRR